MEVETKDHLIAATNILFGVANFLILSLPKAWRFGREISPPEVDSNIRRGDSLWVTSGRASHILYNEERGVGLELVVIISKGKARGFKPKASEVSAQGPMRAGGHEATYLLGRVKRGFFKKKMVETLQLSFYCDRTGRTITLNLTGDCAEGDLQQILEAIPKLECH